MLCLSAFVSSVSFASANSASLGAKKQLSFLKKVRQSHWRNEPYTPPPFVIDPPLVENNSSPLDIPVIPIGKIEVSIGQQKVYVYDTLDTLLYSSLVVTGKSGVGTPRGTYPIQRKRSKFYMQGCLFLNGKEDCWNVWVNYASYFTGRGHALHDAPYRSRFGTAAGYSWNGSHGCVNMPRAAAEYIYHHAPMGTNIVIF